MSKKELPIPKKIYLDSFRLAAVPELINRLDCIEEKINEIIDYLHSLKEEGE